MSRMYAGVRHRTITFYFILSQLPRVPPNQSDLTSKGVTAGLDNAQVIPPLITSSQYLLADNLSPYRLNPWGTPRKTCTLVGTLITPLVLDPSRNKLNTYPFSFSNFA